MKRNFFRLILVFGVFVCLLLIPQVASAEVSGIFGENIQWSIDDIGVLAISGTGDMPEVVSTLDVPWSNYTNHVIIVNIDEGVTSISDHAFNGFKELEYISMPDSLKSIGYMSFRGCISLDEITFSDGIENIENYAFYSCSFLKDVEMPENLKRIGNCAFAHCTSLEKIVIPDTVTYIGEDAFNSCSSLREISIPFVGVELNTQNDNDKKFHVIFDRTLSENSYYNFDVPQTLKKVTVTNQEVIPYSAFSRCRYIEEIIIGDKTNEILDSAFSSCESLKSVMLKNDACKLGNGLFSGCKSLVDFEFPVGIDKIGDHMFSGCTSLTDIVIPDTVTAIGNSAFRNCTGLRNITFSDDIKTIGEYAFYSCTEIDEIQIPDKVTDIGDYAFANLTKLEIVTVPDNVNTIGKGAFQGCNSIVEFTLPFVGQSDEATGEGAVFGYIFGFSNEYLNENCAQQFYSPSEYHCYFVPDSIKKVTITNDTGLHYGAFDDCEKIKEIKLPDTLKNIADYAFYNCDGLEKISFPESVISVGNNLFEHCDNISEVTFYSKEIDISDNFLNGSNITKINGYYNSDAESFANENNIEFYPLETLPDNEKKTQNVLVSELSSATYGDDSLTVTVIPDSISQLMDFTFESSNTNVAEISAEGVITIKATGETNIMVKQAGNDKYLPFENVQKLVVDKKNITVTSVDLLMKTAVLDGVLSCDTEVILDFDKVKIEITEPSDETTSKVNVTNLNLKGEKSENYIIVTESIESTITTDNIVVLAITATNGTTTGAGTYLKGSNLTVTATPDSGYKFGGWYMDNKSVSKNISYTFVLNSDTELKAEFLKKSSGGGGGGGGSTYKPSTSLETEKPIEQEKEEQPDIKPEENEKPVASVKFNDVSENDWYYEYVNELTDMGIISGYEDGNFYPDNLVKREEFVKMLISAVGFEEVSPTDEFVDVNAQDWFATYVYAAKANGVINGINETTFGVGQPILRQDMAVMIYNILPSKNPEFTVNSLFEDNSDISDYASNAVYTIRENKIINGYEDGTFKPKASLTRAETAKIMCELIKIL